MRVKQSERGVVADRTNVAEMIGETFELRHQSAQIECAARHFDFERRFDGGRKSPGIGDRAVARDATGKTRRAIKRRIHHQPVDALMHIAEPLFEPDDDLAIRGETKMTGFDNARMHRPHRDLMQRFAFGRQKLIWRAGRRRQAAHCRKDI